jgi:hypothetical protein
MSFRYLSGRTPFVIPSVQASSSIAGSVAVCPFVIYLSGRAPFVIYLSGRAPFVIYLSGRAPFVIYLSGRAPFVIYPVGALLG